MKKNHLFLILTGFLILSGTQVNSQNLVFNTTIISTADDSPQSWKYTTETPTVDWNSVTFDDTAWTTGNSGFGSSSFPATNTVWLTNDIWLRKTFNPGNLSAEDIQNLTLKIFYDDNVDVFINGVAAFSAVGYVSQYMIQEISAEAKLAIISNGNNVISVHCQQLCCGQFIDCGIQLTKLEPAISLLTTGATAPQTWKYTTTAPAADWNASTFVDTDWTSGTAGFGSIAAYNTLWYSENSDIWLRKSVNFGTLTADQINNTVLNIFYDDNVEIYINGVLGFSANGYITNYTLKPLTDAAKNAIVNNSDNLIAVKCHQIGGGQFIDLGFLTSAPKTVTNVSNISQPSVIVSINPTTSLLSVKGEAITRISIFNICGTMVKTVQPQNENISTIDVSSLSSGVYMTSVLSKGKTSVAKFIKK